MDPDQFKQFCQTLAGSIGTAVAANVPPAPSTTPSGGSSGTKLRPLTETSPSAWLNWRTHCVCVGDINAWSLQRRKLELRQAMAGDAMGATKDVPIHQNDDSVTFEAVLDAFAERFIPKAEGRLAKASFRSAAQTATETIAEWHQRCRNLFLIAYPKDDVDKAEAAIVQFFTGLKDADVRKEVVKEDPDTFSKALEVANNIRASLTFCEDIERKEKGAAAASSSTGATAGSQLNYLTDDQVLAMGETRTCNACYQPGHLARNCPRGTRRSGQYGSPAPPPGWRAPGYPPTRGRSTLRRNPYYGRGRNENRGHSYPRSGRGRGGAPSRGGRSRPTRYVRTEQGEYVAVLDEEIEDKEGTAYPEETDEYVAQLEDDDYYHDGQAADFHDGYDTAPADF